MGQIHTRVDFSEANAEYQVRLLGRAIREHLDWPSTNYLNLAVWRRDQDIAETGNDHRFNFFHPRFNREIKAFEAQHATPPSVEPPVTIPVTSPPSGPTTTGTGNPPPGPSGDHGTVAEPASWMLVAIGLGLVWAGCRVKERRVQYVG